MRHRVVVLGGGESGYGSAVLARKRGFDTFLSDSGLIEGRYVKILDEWGVEFEQGGHTAELILSADEIVKSPGIPDSASIVRAALERGIPVISEIEFAGRYTAARTICITGSNGKTTTTTLTYEILADAGFDVGLGGNIGDSFAYSVATRDYEWYVLELSSFQLDGLVDFRADVAVLMNITPDHLDRYDYNMDLYTDSKMRIVRNQGQGDAFIYCADDDMISGRVEVLDLRMCRLPFSAVDRLSAGGWLDGDDIVVAACGASLRIPLEELKVRGIHNIYNVMAASLASLSVGVEAESILKTVCEFRGVEHRLEQAGYIGGVEYINDSKATNVDSVWYALESMTKPVVWIAGGTDKGNDYGRLRELAGEKVKALVCMGVDNGKLSAAFKGVIPVIYDTNSLESAMCAASELAEDGDVVLLSPACASFDLFRNYEDRGQQFKRWVDHAREE